jgi:hypothetical protein
MKRITLFCSILLSAQICVAQNPMFHLANEPITSMDYDPVANQYALIGGVSSSPLAGFPNTNPHISFNIFDNATNSTVLSKTFITADELAGLSQCPGLGARFYVRDVRKTSDRGYIICGRVIKDQEVSQCSFGLTYNDPFLLKTDMSGNVLWYKRYSNNNVPDHLGDFYSVIENEQHNGFIVCGSRGFDAFVMSVNSSGTFQWSHFMQAYQYNNTSTQLPSSFTRICRYTDPSTQQVYYALTGTVGQEYNIAHVLSYGGGLLTLIDANGSVFTNVQITNDNNIQFMQFSGITDAYDGDVVLTGCTAGSIGGGTCTIGTGYDGKTVTSPYNPPDIVNLKINPLTLNQSFLKVYETGLPNSRGVNVVAYAAGGNISVSAGNGNTSYGEGEYLETDASGNLVRFTRLGSTYTSGGTAIVYNSVNGYVVYGGGHYTSGPLGYLVKNKFGNDNCATDYPISITDPIPAIVNNTFQDDQVFETTENITAFNLTGSQTLVCGSSKKQAPSAIEELSHDNMVTVFPNPASKFINVILPAELKTGTIEVLDIVGNLVYSAEFHNVDYIKDIDISALRAGTYICVLKNDHTKYNKVISKY